jgi:anti-anti-sigma factor
VETGEGYVTANFSISISNDREPVIVQLTGELDILTADNLRQRLQAIHGDIVIDLDALSFIDAAGLSVMIEAAQKNGGVRITNPTSSVKRVFDICGLGDLLADPDTCASHN